MMEEKRSPLHDCHLESGAKLVPFAGWMMPVSYGTGIKEEHLAVRHHAGMFDVSHMGQIDVEGPGARAFLQRVLSNDVDRLADGRAQYSCLCNEAGGVEDDVFTYRYTAEKYLMITNAANHQKDLGWLLSHRGEFDCSVRDAAGAWAMIAVQGPRARKLVGSLLKQQLPTRLSFEPVGINGGTGLVCGTGYTGEDGVELLVDPAAAGGVWRKLLDAGVVPCGLGARDSLRLDVCFHLHGNDMGPDINPIEAGLGWCCKEETGFIGSGAISRFRAAGTERKLAAFKIEDRGIAREGNPVIDEDGKAIGQVTSGVYSPSLRIGVGMAYVPAALAVPGQEIEIDVRGRVRRACIADKPLYKKENSTDE